MGLDPAARYVAVDVDRRALDRVEAFLDLVGQPHEARALDLVSAVPDVEADVALALKLVTTLDRQDRSAASRLLASIRGGPRGRQLHDALAREATSEGWSGPIGRA